MQQQAQHALRQHMGLAGTGIGGDPGSGGRVGGLALRGDRIGGNFVTQGHHSPPSSPADHSFTRARWS